MVNLICLTRILRVIRPIENGIAFQELACMLSKLYYQSYQMYMQVYFSSAKP